MRKLLFVYAFIIFFKTINIASAHSIIGNRIFPTTLSIEDPGITDEFSVMQTNNDEENDAKQTITSGEFSKRITKNFGISIAGAWISNSNNASGLDNFDVGAKYSFYKDEKHELILSAGLDLNIGNSGAKRMGVENFSTFVPTLFFGKGMGDLPDSADFFKPFAVTGILGYTIPTRNFSWDLEMDNKIRNPQSIEWGATLQYSLPYLQQHVKDIGLTKPFNLAIPIVEFALQTETNGPQSGQTTGTINPGIIFMGNYIQVAFEAQIPINRHSGNNVGYLMQLHFFLDNIFPKGIGKTLW